MIKLPAPQRRAQLLEVASRAFAATGLHGTTTQTLADSAGISEPVLYDHFPSKQSLFRAALQHQIELRLALLQSSLALPGPAPAARAALATISGFLHQNAALTNWALVEDRDYAVARHRDEARLVQKLWLNAGVLAAPLALDTAVRASLAYGLWLAATGESNRDSAASARRFAALVSDALARP